MRKKFLVKPSLQIRHLTWTLGLVLFSCLIGYFLFENLAAKTLQNLAIPQENWASVRQISRWGFTLILFILMVAVGIENYFLFHKFVGPLHAIENGLKRVATGDLSTAIQIRGSDELNDLVNAFENMRKEMRLRLSTQEKLSESLAADVDRLLANASQNNMNELREQLLKIRKQIQKEAA